MNGVELAAIIHYYSTDSPQHALSNIKINFDLEVYIIGRDQLLTLSIQIHPFTLP